MIALGSSGMRSSAPPSLAADPFVGNRIPSEVHAGVSFRIERKLGEGGTASAYFAEREAPDGTSPAVIKVIHPHVAMEHGETAHLVVQKESVALGRLNERVPPTPFVVRLMDTGSVSYRLPQGALRLPWLAVEYVYGGVEGTTLEDRVDYCIKATGFGFEPERAARLIRHVAEGMAEIHDVGVVHRDITPNNVLCCGFGDQELFKISDFGIARPVGVKATFGDVVLGTPGFLAPEQGLGAGAVPIGPYSDVFGFAAVVYYVLTGQLYFNASNAVQALMAVKAPERRSLAGVPTLCPELGEQREALAALDHALARATSEDPRARPQTARAFAATVLSALEGTGMKASRRNVVTMSRLRASESAPGWTWNVRHPSGDDRVVSSVGWDADGHCLASTTGGLQYWDGTSWTRAPDRDLPFASAIQFVRRVGAGRWLVGTERATLAEYSRQGVTRIVRGPHDDVAFTDASGELGDLAVVVGRRPDGAPLLYGVAAGRFLRPMMPPAAYVSGLARIDDLTWLVVGRTSEGLGYAGLYSPLEWHVAPIDVPGRALLACASRPERETAIAVGSEGVTLRIERGRVVPSRVAGSPDLATASLDVVGREWAGGSGQLFMSADGAGFTPVWRDPAWRAPFVSVFADPGLVVAMTVDGGVLEARAPVASLVPRP